MKKAGIYTVFIFICFIISCNDDTSTIPVDENYLEITINGEKFILNTIGGGYKGISEQKTCDGKPSALDVFGILKTGNFQFEISLFHYLNLSDFEDSKDGSYNVGSYILSENDDSKCNLDALVYLEDKNEDIIYTTLMPGAIHTVTELTNSGLDNNSPILNAVKFEIKGEVNDIVFINSSDKEVLVSVKYHAYIFIQE